MKGNPGSIVTFGEIMLRLSPPPFKRLIQARQLEVEAGGAEGNVAVSLAQLGHHVMHVTRLPDHVLGDRIIHHLQQFGVDTTRIVRGGSRTGLYFLEHGASVRPSRVIYDRADSAMAECRPEMIPWKEIFKDRDWFHLTGITPALSSSCAQTSLEAVETARKAGLTVSCDINYRSKLWDKGRAREVMTRLLQFVDVLMANEQDAADVFDIRAEGTNVGKGVLNREAYEKVARALAAIGGASVVAITLRESRSASDNRWSALVYDGKQILLSRTYDLHLVDRVGGGDAFSAGLIHGLVQKWPLQRSVEFGVGASAWKQTIPGDSNYLNEEDIISLVQGDITGRVQR